MPLCGRNRPDSIPRMVPSTRVLLPLIVGDCGPQILHFDRALADEYDLRDFIDSGHPGIAD